MVKYAIFSHYEAFFDPKKEHDRATGVIPEKVQNPFECLS